MKKIITTIAFIALSTVSVKAIEMPNLSFFSLTAGIASNESVWGADAEEKSFNEAGVFVSKNRASGVFTDDFTSQFIELGIGKYVSIGYDHTPDGVSTPTNSSREGDATETTVQADFDNIDTTYIKLNIPGGAYIKAGTLDTDVDVKSQTSSGNVYKGKFAITGQSYGIGYERHLGETGFGMRFETNYIALDDIKSDNGVALTGGTAANGGRNEVAINDLEGLTARVAITYTFSRNN